jgi:hypothetical protein
VGGRASAAARVLSREALAWAGARRAALADVQACAPCVALLLVPCLEEVCGRYSSLAKELLAGVRKTESSHK